MSTAAVDETSSYFITRPWPIRPEEKNLVHNDTDHKSLHSLFFACDKASMLNFIVPRYISTAVNLFRLSMQDNKENCTFLNPRAPSLFFGNKLLQAPRRNLFSLLEDDEYSTFGNVKVYLRIKPWTQSSLLRSSQEEAFVVKNSHTLIARMAKDSVTHEFQFTKILKAETTQEEVYNQTVHDLVKSFLNGQNCLLFAYGTSNAGKTYTIQGTPQEPGVLPRAINTLFNSIKGRSYRSCKFKPDMVSRILKLDEKAVREELAYKQKIMTWSQDKFHGSDQSNKSSYTQLSECSWDKHSETTYSSLTSQTMASKSTLLLIDESIEKELAQETDSNCYSEEDKTEEEVEKKNEEKLVNESGTPGTSGRGLGEMEEQQDVTSNVFQEMQSRLSNLTSDIEAERNTVFSVWVSFAEIYNENVYDLLEPIAIRGQRRPNLPLGQDSSGQVYIKGLRHIWVTTGEEAYQAMIYGQHNLKFAPTGLNSVSSRSHCIFTIKLLQHKDSELPKFITVSMFSFCDLAGAERVKNTQNVGERLRESQNINTSLHVLGRCLMTIRDNQATKNKKLIPFRDSKLTRLFQRALNGKESIRMIVNVNPSLLLKDETYNVLTFSAIAKQIILQPERYKKRVTRASRFSKYISKAHHNYSRETSDSSSSLLKTHESEALHSQIEKLTDMVENLKACLSAERKEKLNIEKQVREELCDHFSKRMAEQKTLWEAELESTELRYEEINDWRVNKLKEHYEKQISRKRLRDDDDDDDYGDNSDADYSNRKSHKDVEYLTERLNITNELTNLEREEKKQLIQKSSELSASLAYCQSELKNAQKIIEAAEFGETDGNENALILELQNQLKTRKMELEKKQTKIQELEGVLEDAKVDFTHLENDYNTVEKERNDLDHKLVQMETENKQHLAALRHKQQLLDQQSSMLDDKDELIKNLKTQLNELQSEIKTKQSNEVETNLQKEIQDLTLKLKESEDEKLNLQKLEAVHQEEICELRKVKDNLEDKLYLTEKAEKEALKNMITYQKSLDEQKKLVEDIKMQSQNKISEMKVKLQSYTDTAALVTSMKHEIENKSSKYDELESENEILKNALETKEIELTHFKENRDEVIKRYEDLFRREKEESEKHKREINAYQQMFSKNTPTPNKQEFEAKIQKLLTSLDKKDGELEHVKAHLIKVEKQYSKCLAQDNPVLEEGSAKSRRNRKKILDENVHPSSAKSSDKRQLKKESKATDSKSVEPTRTRSRRRMLFTENPDDAEFSPVEIKEDNTGSLQPERLLRSRRV